MPQLQNSTPDPTLPTMMGGSPEAAMGMPSGPVSPDSVTGEPDSAPPIESPAPAPGGGTQSDGLKRQLLQKMMENLLNKPGRSVNELVNGVKAVIGAYKNYAREWDTLSGITEAPLYPEGSSAGGSSEIQDILSKIQAEKGSAGGAPQSGSIDSASAIPPPPPIGPMDKGPSGLGGPGFNRPAPINRLGIWGF